MAMILAFTTVDKMAHNSRKFAFTLSPTNYGYWKTMIEPFLITNNLMGYVDGSISCPSKTLSVTNGATVSKENPNYLIWVSNDAYVRMLIISTISEASFCHVQGLREEYNGLKTTITARQSPTAFSELHALLSDHDYMLGKTRTPIAPYGPQAIMCYAPTNNNRYNKNNNRGNRNNSPEWRQAIKEEYDALMKNGTWSLVPRASTTNVVDGKGSRLLNYFLGIEIVSHVSGILLSQKKYILELLQSAGLSNCNPVSSPMVTSSSLSLDDSTAFSNPVKYRQGRWVSFYMLTYLRPCIQLFAVTSKALADIQHLLLLSSTWLQGATLNELGIRSTSTPIPMV
ncbi:ribonuclease H-like domain-containing protein [Tanacetum coccineum]